ncbi:MAG: hypothetical protein O2894_12280 [Planctomycetota bacterium]|nr:hypothetical protein [Planctomycetota bacterium]
MAGNGGYKHRKIRIDRKRTGQVRKAQENIRRVRNQFEAKGQTWEPTTNPAQLAALNHAARRVVSRTAYSMY